MKFLIDGRDKTGRIRLDVEVNNPFDVSGTWLRGNLHCHVAQLGRVETVCDWYRDRGFDFLASTDYETITALPASTDEFITLGGAEAFDPAGDLTHLLCLGLTENLRPPSGGPSAEELRRLTAETRAQGGVSVLAHPAWSGLSWRRLLETAGCGVDAFELTNTLCGRINGQQRSDQLWRLLAAEGVFLSAVGADDANEWSEDLNGVAWTGVLVQDRMARGVLDAIRAGRTYASEGPELRGVEFDPDGYVRVRCSPCVACHFQSAGYGIRSVFAASSAEAFEVDLHVEGYRMANWVSVSLVDERGRAAWSSAMPVQVKIQRRP